MSRRQSSATWARVLVPIAALASGAACDGGGPGTGDGGSEDGDVQPDASPVDAGDVGAPDAEPDLDAGTEVGADVEVDAHLDADVDLDAAADVACATGFERVGGECADIDECAAEVPPCAPIACANTDGSFTCACPAGWSDPEGDASRCVDQNECAGEGPGHDCHEDAVCSNRLGGYDCACRPGFSGDGRSCTFAGAPRGFVGGPVFGVDDYARGIGGGDLNGDGELDIVVATMRNGDVQVILSDGSGGHAEPVSYVVHGEPLDLAVVDLDDDGHLDVLVTNDHALVVLQGDGSGALSWHSSYSGDDTRAFLVEDLNADGELDVAIVSWGDDSLKVHLGDGSGTLPAATSVAAGDGPNGLCAGDFDGNGTLDLVVSNHTLSTHEVNILFGDGVGGFGAPAVFASFAEPGRLACADFDDDGNVDVAVETDENLRILFGSGAGTVADQGVLTAGGNPATLLAADLDQDGRDDLVAGSIGLVHVFLNDGTRSLSASMETPAGSVRGLAVVDYDGNAAPDLAVSMASGLVGLDPLAVLPGAGDGSFIGPEHRTGGGGPIRVVDVDGDGHLDLVGTTEDSVVTLRGDGLGNLTLATTTPVGSTPVAIAVADVDEDGHLDLLVANNASDDISIVLADGAGGFSESARITADGEEPEDVEVGDFDEDGHLDFAIVNDQTRNVVVRFGDGSGAFDRMTTFDVPSTGRSILVGDINEDHHLDLVVGHSNITGRITRHHGDGRGGFVSAPEMTTRSSVRDVVLADVNEDGHPDLVASQAMLSVFLSDGAGGFLAEEEHPIASMARRLVVGDFDEDRHLDVVTGIEVLGAICLQRGDGTGAFGDPECHGLATAYNLAVGDLDEDSHLDVLASGWNVAIFFN